MLITFSKNSILLLCFFTFYFGLKFTPNFYFLYAVYLLPLLVGMIAICSNGLKFKVVNISYPAAIILTILVTSIINLEIDNLVITILMQSIFNILCCYGFYVLWFQRITKDKALLRLCLIVSVCVIIQAVCVILYYLNPSFQNVTWTILQKLGNIAIDQNVRSFGFSNAGGDGLGYKMVGGLICIIYLFHVSKLRLIKVFGSVLCIMIFLISMLLLSRTALLASLLILIFYALYLISSPMRWGKVLIIISSCLVLILLAYFLFENNPMIANFQRNSEYWALAPFQKGLKTHSVQDWMSMIRFPVELKTWLIGDGLLETRSSLNYMGTDIGYLRLLFFVGILGSLLLYTYTVHTYQLIYKRCEDKFQKLFIMLFLLLIFLFNFKTLFFDGGQIVKWTCLLYLIILYNSSETLCEKN